ncbi:hypothetical protein GCM10023149_31100 [Mucilaginibacter gynuensis]|uniref:Transcriptional regulator n=1 Tax=Mucilaginibacter gynuensis TaxID=1302236 RepID=A0ABP8GP61_9SPHI
MELEIKEPIPTEFLPDGWREAVAEALNVSVSTVSKVANCTRRNDVVYDHLLDLAAKNKLDMEAKAQERAKKLEQLTASQPTNN